MRRTECPLHVANRREREQPDTVSVFAFVGRRQERHAHHSGKPGNSLYEEPLQGGRRLPDVVLVSGAEESVIGAVQFQQPGGLPARRPSHAHEDRVKPIIASIGSCQSHLFTNDAGRRSQAS